VARNVAIIALIAAVVYAVPGGGQAANAFESALLAAFGVAIGYLGLRLYRESRTTLYGLGDRYRALLYGALGGGALLFVARQRMWESGLGELLWFVLIGLAVYALLAVYRHWRAY
jgi:hypothetical protein